MKKLLLLFAVTLAVTPLQAQRGIMAAPIEADTISYPIMKRPITVADMARMNLHPMKLDTAVTVLNWYRDKNRFLLETLVKGTVVLQDSAGVIRYKADCSNRLVEMPKCPNCLTVGGIGGINPLASLVSDGLLQDKSATDSQGFFERNSRSLWSWLSRAIKSGLWLLGLLAGLLLIPLLLLLLGALIWWIWRSRQEQRNVGGGVSSNPQSRVPVVVTPPAPSPVDQATTSSRRFVNYSASTSTNAMMLRSSGFSNVRCEEAADGVLTIRCEQ